MLSVKDLGFYYGDRKVLNNISFDAEPNTIISILGPNGVGKTTLLKCLCNIHRPQEGKIEIDGTDILQLSGRELAKHVGFVPQSTKANGTMVFDAIMIGRRPYIEWGISKKDTEIVWEVVRSLGLENIVTKRCDEISGGEFQKVQIARAMVQQPEILILDEPTNNLDVSNQHISMNSILHAVGDSGMCTIMTMHDINLAASYSDYFMFIAHGTIVAYGGREIITPELIKEVYGIDCEVIWHNEIPMVMPEVPEEVRNHYDRVHRADDARTS